MQATGELLKSVDNCSAPVKVEIYLLRFNNQISLPSFLAPTARHMNRQNSSTIRRRVDLHAKKELPALLTYRRFDEPNSVISVCGSQDCKAINSPAAQICWKCKEPLLVQRGANADEEIRS
jgi:hypothetical protein